MRELRWNIVELLCILIPLVLIQKVTVSMKGICRTVEAGNSFSKSVLIVLIVVCQIPTLVSWTRGPSRVPVLVAMMLKPMLIRRIYVSVHLQVKEAPRPAAQQAGPA